MKDYSAYRDNGTRRNVKRINKRDIGFLFAVLLIALFLYSISRWW